MSAAPLSLDRRPSRRRPFVVGGLLLATFGLVLGVGWLRADRRASCIEGLAASRDAQGGLVRCCGQGQRLEQGACRGKPSRCAAAMRITEAGCAPQPSRVRVAGGKLRVRPVDWEAQPVGQARETDVGSFLLDSHEVTEEPWRACELASACPPLPSPGTGEPGRPVTSVTAGEAEAFCRWAGGRLPTSDELVLAAQGPEGRRYPWGDTGAVCRRAAFGLRDGPCGRGATGPELAGSHPDGATVTGIHDLAGNVAEWAGQSPAEAAPASAPDPSSPARMPVHGGSWQDAGASALRAWSLRWVLSTERSAAIGFRCAYSEPTIPEPARSP